ncbi:Hypothetical Protein FCC1311_108902 [Hondaea fermentalgiana]|uniref:Uncharacterized protein n=1 Tax=Hondaea fermentalgiana TaxID=2315210 RepID=A0A2R5GXZ3_9STRA|nr:Hypothetical Protein FCC1311_108902 [Hondaea fermentalgiana]|eukprot:GBG34668.1 Hypothetical Protein FCC1311_108902 [Hondaea fermentalgiana]
MGGTGSRTAEAAWPVLEEVTLLQLATVRGEAPRSGVDGQRPSSLGDTVEDDEDENDEDEDEDDEGDEDEWARLFDSNGSEKTAVCEGQVVARSAFKVVRTVPRGVVGRVEVGKTRIPQVQHVRLLPVDDTVRRLAYFDQRLGDGQGHPQDLLQNSEQDDEQNDEANDEHDVNVSEVFMVQWRVVDVMHDILLSMRAADSESAEPAVAVCGSYAFECEGGAASKCVISARAARSHCGDANARCSDARITFVVERVSDDG